MSNEFLFDWAKSLGFPIESITELDDPDYRGYVLALYECRFEDAKDLMRVRVQRLFEPQAPAGCPRLHLKLVP